MKIIIDDKIPYIQGAFEHVAEVVYLAGAKTTAEIVKDADVIVTRTRTICNEALLAGSSVKLIATATIGYDHIDTEYCNQHGIKWTNAPGCNSKSVEQYIASALMVLAEEKGWTLSEKCIELGMKVLLNDPPREKAEGSEGFVSIEKIKNQADIISLHVPLNMTGEYATYHLGDDSFFDSLKKNPVLLNSCRGEVIDTKAAKSAIKNKKISSFVCDCWENEPSLDLELLELTEIATPHIAGYSKDGKATGTQMSVQAISDFYSLGMNNWQPKGVELPTQPDIEIDGLAKSEQMIIAEAIWHTYNIRNDDKALRENPSLFEHLRGDYPVRREFQAYTIKAKNVDSKILEKLKNLGFG